MKLKLVVVSMSILGLVSSPVFANHNKHHTAKQAQVEAPRDYKDMAMPKVCTVSASALTLVEASQNVGRSIPNPCNPGWFDRIKVSGGINFDLGKWGNRNANIMGENYQRLSLNDVYINVAGSVNDWTTAFASLSFNTATTNRNPGLFNQVGVAEYSAAYSNNIGGGANNVIQVEQAFATFANFDVTPVYVQAGKFFQDFSRYEIHPITASMTQVMSETLSTALKVGFVAEGFNGGISVFNDPINKIASSASPTNYGISVGYNQTSEQLGFDLGAGYQYNLIGANDVAYSVNNFTGNGYNSRVGGFAAYGDVNSGPFMLGARYTQAVQRFSGLDLTKNGNADLCLAGGTCAVAGGRIGSGTAAIPMPASTGAKPWAAGLQAGYGFDMYGRSQNVYLGYQTSREAAGLNLPKNRYVVGYGVNVVKDTMVGVEWDHDNAFSTGNGGSGNNTNLVSLRAAVMFN